MRKNRGNNEACLTIQNESNDFQNLKTCQKDNKEEDPGFYELKHVDLETGIKLRKTSEFFWQLSTILPETQKYSSPMVACACVVAARKCLKIYPLLNKEFEKLIRLSEISSDSSVDPTEELYEWTNLILSNSKSINVRGEIFPTESLLGHSPNVWNESLIEHEEGQLVENDQNYGSLTNQAGASIFTPNKVKDSPEEYHNEGNLENKSRDNEIGEEEVHGSFHEVLRPNIFENQASSFYKEPASYDNIFDRNVKIL